MDITYWSKDLEMMDRAGIEALQLTRLQALVDQSLKTEFYKKRLNKAGYREELARTIASGTISYFQDYARASARQGVSAD